MYVATTMNSLQCTLFVATTMNWKYMCTVCQYYEYTTVYSVCGHCYELQVHMYCLWPLLQTGSTHVLFVATTMNWENTCTVCGHYYELEVHVYCLWPLLANSLQCTPPIVFRVWYNNNIVSTMTYTLCLL